MNLDQVEAEIRAIIAELNNISNEIRNDFSGIGQEMCANCIYEVAEHYRRRVLPKLNQMERNRISQLLDSFTGN